MSAPEVPGSCRAVPPTYVTQSSIRMAVGQHEQMRAAARHAQRRAAVPLLEVDHVSGTGSLSF